MDWHSPHAHKFAQPSARQKVQKLSLQRSETSPHMEQGEVTHMPTKGKRPIVGGCVMTAEVV